jgi:transketolase
MALRTIPHLTYLRPADANETAEAWWAALKNTEGPTALALTRQDLPTLDRSTYGSAEGVHKGAYILSDDDGTPDVILRAPGSEVQLALDAAGILRDEGHAVRVVSMPSWELFEAQPAGYRDDVLPPDVTARVSVEAGVTFGWERYIGSQGRAVGLDRFGASAPYEVLYEKLGLTPEKIAEAARATMK